MSNEKKELYEFRPFRLDTEKRLLMRDEEPVPLQWQAFETPVHKNNTGPGCTWGRGQGRFTKA